MANSPLDFPSTQSFRNRLNGRNLAPYPKSPRRFTPPINYEFIQSDYHVIDSPDQTIDVPTFANQLFPLNQYGSTGGYTQTRDPNSLLNTHSNEGEYGVQDANIIDEARTEARNWRSLNPYGSGSNAIIDSADAFNSLDLLQLNNGRTSNSQPYPTTFVSSFYSPVSILLSPNPNGSNGNLSQDSYIVRLGAKLLRKEFEERIAAELYRQTLGRANLPGLNPVLNTIGIINGTVPIVQPNYQITVPSNPVVYAADFALRLAGSTIPFSPIPGSYFDPSINPGQPTTIQQLANAYNNTIGQTQVGQFLATILGTPKTGSQIFLNNTGGGQKKRLFFNIDYNKYKPGYDRTLLDRLGGAIFGTTFDNSNYYIGSPNSEPSRILSPSRQIPVNEFGKEIPAPVYGPTEIAQLYEGEISKQIKLGANGPTYSDGGGIEGGMTWVSPKYKGNAGKKVGVGGEIVKNDTDFKESSYNSTESTNLTYRTGSILDDTQRIINSQPQGGKRLQHVGNAIDQVSKVFNDGYKELTKGSRVLSYVGAIGQEKGAEYCRVFSKDVPYLQYNDLQKTDGITTEGRRFTYSVLDKTYNLNIYPNKREGGQDSTNLIGDPQKDGKVKKYMFSLENLAWRTSNKPGYTVSDLPVCERGPNGGRIMWFPPYDLKFTEGSTANWKGTDFLGRPEPIYTYNNTTRTGSLSWKIVVDHPSVLNVIVNKVLANETNKVRVNSILDSFFAGCRKYDLYELAKKYYTVNPNDIQAIQKELQYKDVTTERVEYVKQSQTTGQDGINTVVNVTNVDVSVLNSFDKKAVYFGNDYPRQNQTNQNYTIEFNRYTASDNISTYQLNNSAATSFFDSVVKANYYDMEKLTVEIDRLLSDEKVSGQITLTISGSASAPAKESYNVSLSQRRINSLKTFFTEKQNLKKHIENGKLKIKDGTPSGENAQVQQYDLVNGKWIQGQTYSCGDQDGKGDNNTVSHEIFTTKAMACRRAVVGISSNLTIQTTTETKTTKTTEDYTTEKRYSDTTKVPEEVSKTVVRDNISKRVLRALLTECDYFETIKEETPVVFDNLREKLKFFNPAFHSTTPEGLNSRLTFLQQCLRPGDTIPVKNVDGTLQYNNAINTAFGVPPVLVLRVGDFYHTKIIPDNLQLTYESLDLNPEGIGIQPMIANVTLSFKFVGGQGLAGAVDRLQNALTFNYYANTEIYDDRSDVTDTSYQVIDKQFLDYFNIPVPPPTVNQVQNNNGQSNGQTIGVITSATTISSGDTGLINYQAYFNGLVDATQSYFNDVINKNKEVFRQYNNAVRQFWTFDRGYVNGNLTYLGSSNTYLFGKPKNIEAKINQVFDEFVKDIDDENDCLISFIKGTTITPKNFSPKVISTLKTNYKNYVKTTKRNNFISALTKTIQDFSILQQRYVNWLSKANTLTFRGTPVIFGTDGYQQTNGNVKVYYISGLTEPSVQTDSMTDLLKDLTTLKDLINNFYTLTYSSTSFTYLNTTKKGKIRYDANEIITGNVFDNFSNLFNDNVYVQSNKSVKVPALKRAYVVLNDDIIDSVKYQTFKNALIGNILSNPSLFGSGDTELEKEFDAFWVSQADSVKNIFMDENNATNKFFDEIEGNTFNKYLKQTAQTFTKTKKREFLFKTWIEAESDDSIARRKSLIKSLGATINTKSNQDTWCDFIDLVYIGKVKFN